MQGNKRNLMAVKDETTGDWILQYYNGDITRLSFENQETTTKAGFPTLVDLKITDFCAFGCPMCYQSSTKQGKQATYYNNWEDSKFGIHKIIDAMYKANVMECALGGGEPTTHPNFVEILKELKDSRFKVGFTTKDYQLYKHKNFKEILDNTDSIAISCNSVEDVIKASKIKKEIDSLKTYTPLYVQTILGLTNYEDFKLILLECKKQNITNITLLGYKEFGFGKTTVPYKYSDEWITFIKNLDLNIGVDSLIVKEWKSKLIEHKVDPIMLVGEEGKFSCYIDAVEGFMAPSSFTNKNIKKFDFEKKELESQFLNFWNEF
jgi:MoaA/NifB/PqqE/SkfB family radical SAM enzyme